MTIQNIDSNLSLAILGHMSMGPLSGYSIQKLFLTTAWKAFSSSPGAIYPALKRLEAAGFIRGTVEKKNSLRPRKVYVLTEKGREGLVAYLSRPVTREDIVWRLDSISLRFAFMDKLLGEIRILGFLQELQTQMETYLQTLIDENKGLEKDMPFCGWAAFQLGLESIKTYIRWARKTHEKLSHRKRAE
jgi:DNA-binding PadR family transcriptional regulator